MPVLPRMSFGSFPGVPTKTTSLVAGRPWIMRTCLRVTATPPSVTLNLVTVVSTLSGEKTTEAVGLPSFDSTLRMQAADSPPLPTDERIQFPVMSGAAAGAEANKCDHGEREENGTEHDRHSRGNETRRLRERMLTGGVKIRVSVEGKKCQQELASVAA